MIHQAGAGNHRRAIMSMERRYWIYILASATLQSQRRRLLDARLRGHDSGQRCHRSIPACQHAVDLPIVGRDVVKARVELARQRPQILRKQIRIKNPCKPP